MQTNPAVEQNKNPWNQSGSTLTFACREAIFSVDLQSQTYPSIAGVNSW